jgi:VIT1/CCC1 family predicted Fe2+/Mn2+ transporter
MALTFVIPVLLFPLDTATIVAIVWGALSLTLLSVNMGRRQGIDPKPIVVEHLGVATLVVVAAHLLGLAVSAAFG